MFGSFTLFLGKLANLRVSLLAGAMAFFLVLAACSPSQPADEAVEATRPSPTAVPAEPAATDVAPITPSETDELAAFIEQLETAVTNQNYAQMQALMSDPIGVGAWRSEWRMVEPAQAIEQFQNGALPAPAGVQFTNASDEEITDLIGQPPATMLGPDSNMVAALHSTGWGQSSGDEAILFVVENDGRFAWQAFLYTGGRFVDANLGAVAPPVGLIYRLVSEGFYQIQADGQHRQLLGEQTANIPNLQVSPDGRHAAYLDDERQLWLVDSASGDQRRLAGEFDLSYFLTWGDNKTLMVGVWLEPSEGDGPNNGHVATLDINSGDLQILDEKNLSGNRPAYLSDYTMVAFDVFAAATTGRLHHPDSGVQVFDPTTFTAGNEMIQGPLFNPAWAPGGDRIAWITSTGERFAVQLFDRDAKSAVQLHDWDPARFGGLVPSPVFSPNGQWLALEVLANGPEGSGLWVLAADGSSQTLVAAEGHDPHWVNDFQLVFNLNTEARLYDITSGEQLRLDLPENSTVVHVTDPAELVTSTDSIPVAETPVNTILALQDVTMFSGPGEEFEEIGGIFDGQTALVTGQSLDGDWWRVICPDDTVGNCWVTADAAYTVPSGSSGPQTTLPDPATLELANETTVESPDGRWQAISTQTAPILVNDTEQFYTSLTVTDGETSWTPVAEWRGYGLGFTWPAVYQWSPDSRQLYYTNMTSPDGCSIAVSGTDLYRLDVDTGNIAEILPAGKTLNFSVSPDESTLIYTTYNGSQEVFVVRDVEDGSENSVVISEADGRAQTAEILWSPDGNTAVLTLVHDACMPGESSSSIIWVDVVATTATTLIEQDARQFSIMDWPNPAREEIRLADRDGNIWLLELDSGKLAQES